MITVDRVVHFNAYEVYALLFYLFEFNLGDATNISRHELEAEFVDKLRDINKKVMEEILNEIN